MYLDSIGITEATWEGEDRAIDINGSVYYIIPGMFLSKEEFMEYEKNFVEPEKVVFGSLAGTGTIYDTIENNGELEADAFSLTFDNSRVPNLTTNVILNTGPYVVRYSIDNMPDYQWMIGCAPTSGAMFVAYYDNEQWDSLSDLDGSSDFTLTTTPSTPVNTNSTNVNILILELAGYFNTIPPTTLPLEMNAGLEEYFDDNGLSEYKVYSGAFGSSDPDFLIENISNYQLLIQRGNPAIIGMYSHPTYSNHASLGMGYMISRTVGSGVIIHDTYTDNAKETFLSYDVVSFYSFIYND